MWYKKKSRNRRFERRRVLDVKLRASQRRQARVRKCVLFFSILFSIAFGGVVVWRGGAVVLDRLIYKNPAFAIYHVEVRTDGTISIDQLRRWAGVKLEDNLFALDLERVKRDLEMIPAIKSASVERVLPHTLRIRIAERDAVVQFVHTRSQSGGLLARVIYHLDADGYVMFPAQSHELSRGATRVETNLSRIVGIPVTELRPGYRAESEQVRAALDLVASFNQSAMAGRTEIRQIDVSMPDILMVTTADGAELAFGLRHFDGQLQRWLAIDNHGRRTGQKLVSLDLSVSNNLPARWAEAL